MDDDIDIRRLTTDDLDALVGVDDGVFDHAFDADQATAFLADPAHEMVVAEYSGRIVAMASAVIVLHPDKQPQLFVNELGVHDDWRRRGIGSRLVGALRALADERGCSTVWLATEDDNEAARGLYRAAGARETAGVVMYEWDADPGGA